jgi:hypothetical protein
VGGNPQPVSQLNLFAAASPGVYEIVCKANGKRYIGEAVNMLDRLGKHIRSLLAGHGECVGLQKDWNTFTQTEFEAHVLVSGPEWLDQQKRLDKERDFLLKYQPSEVYNKHPLTIKQPKRNQRVICEINNVRYDSIAEARRLTGESETRIRAKLRNKCPGYVIINEVDCGYSQISVKGITYNSIVEAVAAGVAKDRFEVMRNLKNPKKPDWYYISKGKP